MKYISYIIITTMLTLLASCNNSKMKNDAMGVFESTEVIVSAEATGKLLSFDIEEGDIVNANTILGLVDTTQLYLKKMQLLASSKAVRSKQADVPTQIAALKQQIKTQKQEKERFANLVKANAGNQKQVDDIDSNIKVLENQLSAQLEVLTKSNAGVNEESASIELQIMQIEDMIEKSIVKSPIDGTILSKYAEKGELASQGRALFKVSDMKNVILRAYISAPQIAEIKTGQEVSVLCDWGKADNKEYKGIITWISDKAEFTPKTIQTRDERANLVYAIKITVKNDGFIKLGMYGEVIF